MRIAGILHESVVDGPGVRFVVFTQGCLHHCKGCHNMGTWDPEGGYEVSVRDLIKEIRKAPGSVCGVTISGGEPFLQPEEVAALSKRIHALGLSVCVFTGYLFEVLQGMNDEHIEDLLNEADILIDGPFVEELKDIGLRFRGSSNQRVIDMNATRESGRIILLSVD